MRKFLVNITIELLLCFALLSGAEILARHAPDAVRFKYNWMKQHSSEIETLVLGPSYTFYGVRAGMFDTKSFNAAFSEQASKYDWLMLTADTVNMTKLKNVILALRTDSESEQPEISSISYKIYCGFDNTPFNRYSFEIGNPRRCKNKIRSLFFGDDWQTCGDDGWTPHTGYHDKKWLELNSVGKFKSGEGYDSHKGYKRICTCKYFELILDYCHRHGIRVIAINVPVYPKYRDLLDLKTGRTSMLDSLGSALMARYDNFEYRDYSRDSNFSERDFFDANHLNSEGATKLTNILKEDFNL